MDLIFEGRLDQNLRIRALLERVLTDSPDGDSLLRINTPEDLHSGKLLLRGGYVVAAVLDNGVCTGYEALKRLAAVADGNFAFLKLNKMDEIDLVPNLNVPLKRIVELAPSLPDDSRALFDEKALLDKVFSEHRAADSLSPSRVRVPAEQSGMNIEPILPPVLAKGDEDESWNLLEPLAGEQLMPDKSSAARIPSEEIDINSLRPRSVNTVDPTKVKPTGGAKTSPFLVVAIIGVIFFGQVLAIFFWPQVVAFFKGRSHHQGVSAVDSSKGSRSSSRGPAERSHR